MDYEACFAPFRYCPVKGCGRPDPGPRWQRVAEAIRAAKAEFDTLPADEQQALRAALRQADDVAGYIVAKQTSGD